MALLLVGLLTTAMVFSSLGRLSSEASELRNQKVASLGGRSAGRGIGDHRRDRYRRPDTEKELQGTRTNSGVHYAVHYVGNLIRLLGRNKYVSD